MVRTGSALMSPTLKEAWISAWGEAGSVAWEERPAPSEKRATRTSLGSEEKVFG